MEVAEEDLHQAVVLVVLIISVHQKKAPVMETSGLTQEQKLNIFQQVIQLKDWIPVIQDCI